MIAFFAKHPTAANLLMIAMLAMGLLNLGGLQRETLPDAQPEKVQVAVVYPGATTAEVEEAIVHRLEDALDGIRFVKETVSLSRAGLGSVTVEMTESGDYASFRNEIDNAINAIDDLPDEAEPPVTERLNIYQPVLDVLISGPSDELVLKRFAENLRDRLIAEPGVSKVDVDGFSDHLLRVELDREAMLRYGLSPVDVSRAISNQSLDLPAGKIEARENLMVRVRESRRSKEGLEDLRITGNAGGAEVRLRDLATVSDEFDLDEDRVDIDGQRAALLKIQKSKSEDVLTVARRVKAILEQQRLETPDIDLTVINDQALLVEDRISLLVRNGAQGCVLVFIAMWMFFNARLSFWVVMSLPVSFLAALALVPSLGLTINMLTLVGLLMALGLLMDDGIVIAENIARRREQGQSGLQAAIHGVREVGSGVFSSFLTTCSVLGPLIFVGGQIGRILRVLPMMLLLVLAASLIEAFLILPSHLGHSLADHSNGNGRFRSWLEKQIERMRALTGRIVDTAIAWRYLTLGLTLMAFLLTLSLIVGGLVRFQVFPNLEGDTIVSRVLMPPGTPLSRTQEVVAELEAALDRTNELWRQRQPGQQDLVHTTFVRYSQNTDAMETGPHVATLYAELLSNEQRQGRITEIVRDWQAELDPAKVADAVNINFDEPALGPTGRAIEIELSGLPLAELDAISTELQTYLSTFQGTYNLADDLRRGELELVVTLRPGAVGLGVTALDLARQLRGSFQGLLSDQIQVGDEAYDVEVRFNDENRSRLSDLTDYLITLPGGQRVPLGEIASISTTRGWSRISHVDGRQAVTVYGSVDAIQTNTAAILQTLQAEKLPELQERHPDLKIRIRGESEKGAETGQSMRMAALVGCLGVFVILSFQFRSYLEPLIVMVAIPFAFVGVVWGHWLHGQSMSLPSMMGYASLAGVVVNDSILLVLFLKSQREQGVPTATAAGQASRLRFRAVIITSLTTIVGLLPLLTERSLQAQVLIPIAISICYGLLASTVLVLLVIPPMYVILHDFGWTTHASEEHDAAAPAATEH